MRDLSTVQKVLIEVDEEDGGSDKLSPVNICDLMDIFGIFKVQTVQEIFEFLESFGYTKCGFTAVFVILSVFLYS